MNVIHTTVDAHCPRCGYDQRGVMAQWTDSCALTGRCAECGLEYRWAELLMPGKFEPLWCVEFARGGVRNVVASCFKTMVRALWPWKFWKQLSMAHDVRWRRLVLFWAFLLAVLLSCYIIEQSVVAVRARMIVQQETGNWDIVLRKQHAIIRTHIDKLESIEFNEDGQIKDTSNTVGHIKTLQERDVALANANLRLQGITAQLAQNVVIHHPLWQAVKEAVFTPGGSVSNGVITYPGGATLPYTPPRMLHEIALQSKPRNARFFSNTTFDALLGYSMLGCVLFVLFLIMLPLEFILLPMSRRKAKVQWRHIWRVAAYSVTVPILVTAITLLCITLVAVVPTAFDIVLRLGMLLAFIPALSIVLWWAVAIGRYMKIPHGWFIAPLFALLAILIASAVIFWGGYLTQDMLADGLKW